MAVQLYEYNFKTHWMVEKKKGSASKESSWPDRFQVPPDENF